MILTGNKRKAALRIVLDIERQMLHLKIMPSLTLIGDLAVVCFATLLSVNLARRVSESGGLRVNKFEMARLGDRPLLRQVGIRGQIL